MTDAADNKAEDVSDGMAEVEVGGATGNVDLQAEAKAEQRSGGREQTDDTFREVVSDALNMDRWAGSPLGAATSSPCCGGRLGSTAALLVVRALR